jgi:hypothetical protein
MKKLRIITPTFIIVVFLLFSGCKKIKEALQVTFTTDETEITFTVNPSPAGDYTFTQEIIQSELDQEIEDNGGDIGKIKSVKIDECIFEVVTPDRNFNEFKSIELYLKSATIAQKRVAWIDDIPSNSTSETLTISNENLQSFLEEDSYTATAKGTLDEELKVAITIKAKVKYRVTVGAI